MMGNWLLFLPPAAVAQFRLEPNMNADTVGEKTLWVGRLCSFRKIQCLQYCAERSWSVTLASDERKAAIEAHFALHLETLIRVQAKIRGDFARRRSKVRVRRSNSGP